MAGPQIPQKYLDIADKSFAKKGVYRTAFALKLALRGDAAFKKEYETYLASKDKKVPTLSRWFKEEWVQVAPYLHDGSIIACGAERTHEHDHKGKACRPLIRMAASTPKTLHELVKECGKEAILKEVHKKENNPDYRIPWHLLTKDGVVEEKKSAKKTKKAAPKKAKAKKSSAKKKSPAKKAKKATAKKAAPKKAKVKKAAKKKTVTRKKVAAKKKAAPKKSAAKKKSTSRKKVTKVASRKKVAHKKKAAAKKTVARKKAGSAKKVVSRKKAAPRKKVAAKAKKKSSAAKKPTHKKASGKKSSRRR